MSKEQLAIWVVPSGKDLPGLQATINDLATANNAPAFIPHTTLFVAQVPVREVPRSIKFLYKTANTLEPFALESQSVEESDFFWKTLFIQFGMTDELVRLYETLRGALGHYAKKPEDIYEINPHLSLLYKDIPESNRQQLARSYTPPSTIEFDTLAYTIKRPEEDPYDIPNWNVQIIEKRG